MFDPLTEVIDHILVVHPFNTDILQEKEVIQDLYNNESAHNQMLFILHVSVHFHNICNVNGCKSYCALLTFALMPSTPSGTLGKTSYNDDTYVMTDFSSGDVTSTSV